jgi:hypothetical protein
MSAERTTSNDTGLTFSDPHPAQALARMSAAEVVRGETKMILYSLVGVATVIIIIALLFI